MLIESAIIVVGALIMDRLFGEVTRYHPIVLFGQYAFACEALCYPQQTSSKLSAICRGVMAWCLAVMLPLVAITSVYLIGPDVLKICLSVLILYFSLGARSLKEHGEAVAGPLKELNLDQARGALQRIVSRDTSNLNESEISTATVETITENTHDAVIAPIFWFLILGVVGVVLFRLANTLDAMWGYRNERYENFGKFSARMDDVLGWPSARLTVLLFSFISLWRRHKSGLVHIMTWGRRWYSPNAGPVMAAGAFALNVRLGGDATYHGVRKSRPYLGDGESATAQHIARAIHLMYQSTYVFVFILLIAGTIQWLY